MKVTPTAQSCLTVVALPNGERIMLVPWQSACVAVATLQAAG